MCHLTHVDLYNDSRTVFVAVVAVIAAVVLVHSILVLQCYCWLCCNVTVMYMVHHCIWYWISNVLGLPATLVDSSQQWDQFSTVADFQNQSACWSCNKRVPFVVSWSQFCCSDKSLPLHRWDARFVSVSYLQWLSADVWPLSGGSENVGESDSCQGNVRIKILAGKTVYC